MNQESCAQSCFLLCFKPSPDGRWISKSASLTHYALLIFTFNIYFQHNRRVKNWQNRMNKTGESEGVSRVWSVHIHTILTRGLIRQQVKAAVWVNQAALNKAKAQINILPVCHTDNSLWSENILQCKRCSFRLSLIQQMFQQDITAQNVLYQTGEKTIKRLKEIPDFICSNAQLLTSLCIHRCNGNGRWTMRASGSVFGDSCTDTYKHLEVANTCQSKQLEVCTRKYDLVKYRVRKKQ